MHSKIELLATLIPACVILGAAFESCVCVCLFFTVWFCNKTEEKPDSGNREDGRLSSVINGAFMCMVPTRYDDGLHC